MKYLTAFWLVCCVASMGFAAGSGATTGATTGATIVTAKDGSLTYTTDASGDRIPDFSYAGYRGGEAAIPDAAVRVVVAAVAGDNTGRIQKAIDYVAALAPDARGIRGAVLLAKGRFEIGGGLVIGASGVVLRGSGAGNEGTLLVATGLDRRTLIEIRGRDDRQGQSPVEISDRYVPVNGITLHVADGGEFKVGQGVFIRRPCTAQWIKTLHMDDLGGGLKIGWKPGTREIVWDRVVTAVNGNAITLDAPLTTAIDSTFGGGTVAAYAWPGRIEEVGVENLRCESAYDKSNAKDEAHSWFAITLSNAQNAWVRQVTVTHFVASAVAVWDSCKRVTVLDCRSLAPISEIAGQRRRTFFTSGQLTLFEDCWSEEGRHDFSVGCCAGGPNAFVQCTAMRALNDSGPIDSWASGVLYDNVQIDGNALVLGNRSFHEQFAGWCAANSVMWQCQAAVIECYQPPTAQNWAYACWGQYGGDGLFSRSNETVRPFSLYFQQLSQRTGAGAARPDLLEMASDANSSPTVEKAAELIAAATKPAPLLSDWIDGAGKRRPISIEARGAKSVDDLSSDSVTVRPRAKWLSVKNGWLVCGDEVVVGGRPEAPWWLGGVRPFDVAADAGKLSIARYVPGREGPGLTDNLDQVTDELLAHHDVGLEHHYGLWYDRRDDDHERTRRMDGDAWPPFYELPFARSGQGLAWDGLSKYDLTKYNPWYFSRLGQFAQLCDEKGLVFIHEQFFQHNIIEDGAHWASCPWRSANNINNTGFPEPPPYVGDKRIFMAEQFYDMTNTVRTGIYRAYIRKCLDNFADEHNVIQLTMGEFTGPLTFMEFWLDTVAEWERETGKQAIIGLSATRDVQDAILADPVRSKIVSVIDIRYWWYQQDGKAYAPLGGESLSPRQHERVLKHKASSFEQVYRAVAEYKKRFPDKAVIYSSDSADNSGWATLMAGGSLAAVHNAVDPALLAAIGRMKPMEAGKGEWMLGDRGRDYLIYSNSRGGSVSLPADAAGMERRSINAGNGREIVWLSRR